MRRLLGPVLLTLLLTFLAGCGLAAYAPTPLPADESAAPTPAPTTAPTTAPAQCANPLASYDRSDTEGTAVKRIQKRGRIIAGVSADTVDQARFAAHLPVPDTPDVDLVIRTSGEQRISNFMLWQVAYAEWIFPSVLWPDFRGDDLLAACRAFASRQRKFGGLPPGPVATVAGGPPASNGHGIEGPR